LPSENEIYFQLRSFGRGSPLQKFNELDRLVKQLESSGIYQHLGDLLDGWETEMRSRSLLAVRCESHNKVHHMLKKITKIAMLVQEILETFKLCGNLMRDLNLFPSEDDCKNIFSNLEKLQVELFFIICTFVHIGSNISE